MTSNGSTAPQPSALRKTPIWTSQTSRDRPSPSRVTNGRLQAPPAGGSSLRPLLMRCRLEDRPADLGAGVAQVVLTERTVDADRPLLNDCAERRIGTIDLLHRSGVEGRRVLDPRQLDRVDTSSRLARSRNERDDLAELLFHQPAGEERAVDAAAVRNRNLQLR